MANHGRDIYQTIQRYYRNAFQGDLASPHERSFETTIDTHTHSHTHTHTHTHTHFLTDADKQQAINVFLGVFQPTEGSPKIWELTTDYYLHHTNARILPDSRITYRYVKR